jgi:hypothetical protein
MPPPSGAAGRGAAAHNADRFSKAIVLQPVMMTWSIERHNTTDDGWRWWVVQGKPERAVAQELLTERLRSAGNADSEPPLAAQMAATIRALIAGKTWRILTSCRRARRKRRSRWCDRGPRRMRMKRATSRGKRSYGRSMPIAPPTASSFQIWSPTREPVCPPRRGPVGAGNGPALLCGDRRLSGVA